MTKITEGYVETASDSLTEEKHCNAIQRRASRLGRLGSEKQPLQFTPGDCRGVFHIYIGTDEISFPQIKNKPRKKKVFTVVPLSLLTLYPDVQHGFEIPEICWKLSPQMAALVNNVSHLHCS